MGLEQGAGGVKRSISGVDQVKHRSEGIRIRSGPLCRQREIEHRGVGRMNEPDTLRTIVDKSSQFHCSVLLVALDDTPTGYLAISKRMSGETPK
jgi:hypothetical protein